METFLGGVGVLAVSGMAWLSYYHRDFYKKRVFSMIATGNAVTGMTMFSVWLLVRTYAATLPELLRSEVRDQVVDLMRWQMDFAFTASMICFGVLAYSFVLLAIPKAPNSKPDR